VATKKKPTRRATAGTSAGRARTTSAKASVKKKTAAKPRTAKPAGRTAAKKPAAARRSQIVVVGRRPAIRASSDRIARRCVFVDVENTSSEEDLFEVLDALNLDRAAQPTEVTAVGNWRAISQRLGRRLAGIGAQLVHSAPATGVKDWSDLWIAVAAGCWLGQSAPGDVLEIVSNDRAFDAVGDAAAARGVIYRRLLHRRGAGIAAAAAEAKPAPSRRSRGGRRRRRGRSEQLPAAAAAAAHAARPAPAHAPHAHAAHTHPVHAQATHHALGHEPHSASREQMLALIARLTNGDPGRWANLDVLEKALKAEGFSRPPGSPRLVTRLRALKEVEIDSHGRVRLAHDIEPAAESAPEAPTTDETAAPAAPAKRRRRRRSKTNGDAAAAAGTVETQSD
jgi:hypothetical protein